MPSSVNAESLSSWHPFVPPNTQPNLKSKICNLLARKSNKVRAQNTITMVCSWTLPSDDCLFCFSSNSDNEDLAILSDWGTPVN